ncbi:MAG: gamma-glutamylcyclotransferase, partial [Gammaproteobacteria bacterium]|nr:gamma-glutamylcyclotransferase [Gammaproteobacteria bacterium]
AAQGRSGTNREYLIELAIALRKMGLEDPHVFDIEMHIDRITQQETPSPGRIK